MALVPADGCWIANWNADADTEMEIYVDVTDQPVWTGELVRAVDLDLDVVRLRDGTVELLDEDEFAEHQVRYGYPADVVARAQATAAELMARVRDRDEPFGDVGRAWLERFSSASTTGRATRS
ncbi:DUF402 domain-containing protein [Paractinoplanes rishiriensis]|uniref:DUF402 domain-containing protein n=1 Tax=Paractinoplanes rishiriensis TaxID=1050105 RepID=UPI001EF24C25|nr:DUF402 domain-containing protein [Actinoplanes rishiriensis]